MAYTKIHQIRKTVGSAIAYITDPEKTEEMLLLYGYECDPLGAGLEFETTAATADRINGKPLNADGSGVLAHHMIQSFSPEDNITAKEAHEIGQEWASAVLKGKYEYVLATHVDKGHIHNHIIFNAVSFADYKKFRATPYKAAASLREASDRICSERGLSVIEKSESAKSHHVREKSRSARLYANKESFKSSIKALIDEAAAVSINYDEFLAVIQSKGVAVKNAYAEEGFHIAFKLPGQKRHTRGITIGEGYSREGIAARIEAIGKGSLSADIAGNQYADVGYWKGRHAQLEENHELFEALYTIQSEGIRNYEGFSARIAELGAKEAGVLEDARIARAAAGRLKAPSDKAAGYKEASKLLSEAAKIRKRAENVKIAQNMIDRIEGKQKASVAKEAIKLKPIRKHSRSERSR